MTNSEKYIAAIEICSSKIIGAVGRTKGDGRMDVIAVEQENTLECVRHGIIHNVEETAHAIHRIVERLEERPGVSPRKITSVYVGLSGRSMSNIPTEIDRKLPEDTEITESILQTLQADAMRANIDSSLEVVEAIPRAYYVNKSETKSPVGTIGSSLRIKYNLIVCRPILKKNVIRVIKDKVGLKIAGLVVTPTAVANLVLSKDEKRLGCMLVDMGAETTTVSIYRKGTLRYLATLPMGGRNITTDITSLSVLEERAEEIKTSSGKAIPQPNPSTLSHGTVKLSDVSNLVVARSEEMVANILEQMVYAGIDDMKLPGGIIVAGGGFNLNRLPELLQNQSELPVRRAALPPSITLEDTKAPSYETIEVISILNAGTKPESVECLETPHVDELPPIDSDYVRSDEPIYDDTADSDRQRADRRQSGKPGRGLWTKVADGLSKMWGKADDGDTEID